MRAIADLPAEVKAVADRAAALLPVHCILQKSWHVLDLAPSGEIFPHVDNKDHLGEYIIGISCLSDAVMRFTPSVHPDSGAEAPPDSSISVWLPRRSLYVMSKQCRHTWQHAIPMGKQTMLTDISPGQWCEMMEAAGANPSTPPHTPQEPTHARHTVAITRGRRMSLIMRDEPPQRE